VRPAIKAAAPVYVADVVADADCRDATNILPILVLGRAGRYKNAQPTTVSACISGTPVALALHATDAIRHGGGPLPSFFFDQAIIPALTGMGISLMKPGLRHRRLFLGGHTRKVAVPSPRICYFNLVKLLDIVLHEEEIPARGLPVLSKAEE
jgi:hypothetical protein